MPDETSLATKTVYIVTLRSSVLPAEVKVRVSRSMDGDQVVDRLLAIAGRKPLDNYPIL